MPVWRPAFQAGPGSATRRRSGPRGRTAPAAWTCCGARSSRWTARGNAGHWLGARRARHGAPRVPVWRPAFRPGRDRHSPEEWTSWEDCARGVESSRWTARWERRGLAGGATCAARSAARAGLETGGPGRVGISHSPEEWTSWQDCARGVDAAARGPRGGPRVGNAGEWLGARRARRGAPRVPVWRPAFQAGPRSATPPRSGPRGRTAPGAWICRGARSSRWTARWERRGVGGGATCAARSAARAGLETGVPAGGAIVAFDPRDCTFTTRASGTPHGPGRSTPGSPSRPAATGAPLRR